MIRYLWCSWLVLWAAMLLVYGAVAAWATAVSALLLAVLAVVAWRAFPEPARLSRTAVVFLAWGAAVFALQLLPLPFLHPRTADLRTIHGVGTLWPGTADTPLTVCALAHASAAALAALAIIRLRQGGLTVDRLLRGIVLVLALEAAYGLLHLDVPFYGPRPNPSASGTLVNRNHFAALMGVGLVASVGLAFARFSYARAKRFEAGLPWALAAALFAAALVASQSRGGAIAAATALVVLPLVHRGRASAAGAGALVAIGAAAIVAANPTVLAERFGDLDQDRTLYWSSALAAGARQPVLGFGAGAFPHAFRPFQPHTVGFQVDHAHNEYVNVFFEGGVVLAALVAFGLVAWFARARADLRERQGPDRVLSAAVIAAVALVAVHSLVDFPLRVPAVTVVAAALVASVSPSFAVLAFIGTPGKATEGKPPAVARGWWAWPAGAAVGVAAAVAVFVVPRESLALSPYDHRLVWRQARAAQRAGDAKRADERFGTAAEMYPAHAEMQRDVGLWFWEAYAESGDTAAHFRASRCLKRALEQRPDEAPRVLAEIWEADRAVGDYEAVVPRRAALAGFLASKGEWKRAMEVFERAEATAQEHDLFAGALHGAGQWGLEATVLERRLAMKSDARAYAAAAEAWSRLGAHEKAVERASTAARIDPAEPRWWRVKGECLRAKGDGMGALEALTEAVRMSPRDGAVRARRGLLYAELSMWGPAAEDFREAGGGREERAAARALAEAHLRKRPEDGEARALVELLGK